MLGFVSNEVKRKSILNSMKWKKRLGFTQVFALIFAIYWFYQHKKFCTAGGKLCF